MGSREVKFNSVCRGQNNNYNKYFHQGNVKGYLIFSL